MGFPQTKGCGDACPWMPGKHFIDWTIPDPKHMEPEEFNKVSRALIPVAWPLMTLPALLRDLGRSIYSSLHSITKQVRDYIKGQIEGLLEMLEKERAAAGGN